MDYKDALEKVESTPEIASAFEEAFGRNASADEISGILADAGVDAEVAEALVTEYQRRRGAVISAQALDDDELDQVAGGGSGNSCYQSSDCDSNFKNSNYWDQARCSYRSYCDEYYKFLKDQ